jgi:hypothetical protein
MKYLIKDTNNKIIFKTYNIWDCISQFNRLLIVCNERRKILNKPEKNSIPFFIYKKFLWFYFKV